MGVVCADADEMGSLPPLGPGQHNVQELLARRHGGDILPLGLHFGDCGFVGVVDAVCASRGKGWQKVRGATYRYQKIFPTAKRQFASCALVPH